MADLSPYPHLQRIWSDGSGSILGFRWTLETSTAAIASAVIAIVLSVTIARLASLLNSLLYLFFLHKRTKSALDDQAQVLAVNSQSLLNFLLSLLSLLYTSRLKALSSVVFFVLFLLTMLLLPLYIVSIFVIERLFSGLPVPMTLGLCGQPMLEPLNFTTAERWSYFSVTKPHSSRVFQNMDVVFSGCTDDGSQMTCSGPINKPFSWDVFESNTSDCWFGKEHCGNSSWTILQRATITTDDLGTARKSRLAVTYISECSHIDDTELYVTNATNIKFMTNITAINESYYGYKLGYTTTNPNPNFTVQIWGSDAYAQSYSLRFWTYPMQGTNFSDTSEWIPVSFLTTRLNGSNQLDDKEGSQTVTLVFNRLLGILSLHPNLDPFFLTRAPPLNLPPPIYLAGKPAGLLACRDQMRLHVRPTSVHPREYTSDDVVAVGRYEEVAEQFVSYLSFLRSWDPEAADALGTDWKLFAASASPTIRLALDGLTGLGLRAASSVDVGGFQVGQVQNITTRAEVTRWFGVSMLYRLYSAQIFTSGVENDWGFGVSPIPSLESNQHWVCSKTLRIAPTYASLNFTALIGLAVFAVIIVTLSFTVEPFLYWIVSRPSKDHKKFHVNLKRALLSKYLRSALHLHRIAVEKTYAYRFSRAANHEAPIYGVKAEETFLTDDDTASGRESPYQSGLGQERNSRSSKVLWATMLQAEEEYVGDYNIRHLQ